MLSLMAAQGSALLAAYHPPTDATNYSKRHPWTVVRLCNHHTRSLTLKIAVKN
jgi:hypothetical protein